MSRCEAFGQRCVRGLQAAKEWQTLLGAVIGFAGIIATIVYTWSTGFNVEQRKRLEDASGLRAELAAEISAIVDETRSAFQILSSSAESSHEAGFIFSNDDAVFRGNIDKLHLLSSCEITPVYLTYSGLRKTHDVLLSAGGINRIAGDGFIVPPVQAASLAQMFDLLRQQGDLALAKLADPACRGRR